jgi:hypothetical protein
MKPQVSGLGFICCLVQLEGGVPSACPKLRPGTHQGTLRHRWAQVKMACSARRHHDSRPRHHPVAGVRTPTGPPRDHGTAVSAVGLPRSRQRADGPRGTTKVEGHPEFCLLPRDRKLDPYGVRLSHRHDDGRVGLRHTHGARPYDACGKRSTTRSRSRLGEDQEPARSVRDASSRFRSLVGRGEGGPLATKALPLKGPSSWM